MNPLTTQPPDTSTHGAQDAADKASAQRVLAFLKNHPNKDLDELVDSLIRNCCLQVAGLGAATAGATMLPSIRAVTAVVGGSLIDLNATHRLQAELLLDLATIYAYPFKPGEKERYLLLALGATTGNTQGNAQNRTEQLLAQGGQQLARKATQRVARTSVGRALPLIGAATTAGSSILMTYVAAQRAKSYLRTGPDSVGDWESSIGTALHELKESDWTGEWLSAAMASLSDTLMEGFDQGAQQAGRAAGRATRKLITFWRNATRPKG